MKTKYLPILFCTVCAILLFAACSSMPLAAQEANTLSPAEKADGWRLLFDGKSFAGWHNFKMDSVRPGWQVTNNTLVIRAKAN